MIFKSPVLVVLFLCVLTSLVMCDYADELNKWLNIAEKVVKDHVPGFVSTISKVIGTIPAEGRKRDDDRDFDTMGLGGGDSD